MMKEESGKRKKIKAFHGIRATMVFAVKATPNPYIMQILKEEGWVQTVHRLLNLCFRKL